MRTLEEYGVDPKSAQVYQWEVAIGETLSPGKALEDRITHSALAGKMAVLRPQTVVNFIADEGRLGVALTKFDSDIRVIELTLKGRFEAAAKHTIKMQKHSVRKRVIVTTDVDAIAAGSADVFSMNMIAGCMANGQDHSNLPVIFRLAAEKLKANGHLVIIRPHPAAGALSTYSCTTPSRDLKAGEDYKFQVRGLEHYGDMDNLYMPNDFLKVHLNAAGFCMGQTIELPDMSLETGEKTGKTAFLMNDCPRHFKC